MSADLDHYEAYYADKLWGLIPSVYREDDAVGTEGGPLRELVGRIGVQAAILRRSIDRMWSDQSIETADDWARACGTIHYEIVTRMGGRLSRRYVGADR